MSPFDPIKKVTVDIDTEAITEGTQNLCTDCPISFAVLRLIKPDLVAWTRIGSLSIFVSFRLLDELNLRELHEEAGFIRGSKLTADYRGNIVCEVYAASLPEAARKFVRTFDSLYIPNKSLLPIDHIAVAKEVAKEHAFKFDLELPEVLLK